MINAAVQYRINHADLALILALVRGRTLARAAEQLNVDVSTVFRSVRRLEASVGTALFEKAVPGINPPVQRSPFLNRRKARNKRWLWRRSVLSRGNRSSAERCA